VKNVSLIGHSFLASKAPLLTGVILTLSTRNEENMTTPFIRVTGPHGGLFVVEFCGNSGRSLTILLPQEAGGDILSDIQDRIPYGLCLFDPADVSPTT